jgi:UDP-N-acetyl-D-mannosaminuronic acid dehydrogenase
VSDISVIGLGYVGLPAAIMFANSGRIVAGVDIDTSQVESIRRGDIGRDEPGLTDRLVKAQKDGRLTTSTSFSPADAFVIAVPTPVREDRSPDLSYVVDACRSVAGHLRSGNLVIVESTISPGATMNTIVPVLEESGLKAGHDFSVAYCPERVLPGNIMAEIVANDRIIGGIDDQSTEKAASLYHSFVTGNFHKTDATTAEMVKLAENTYRDVNIALANTLANISESVGVSIWDVVKMANMHPRVDIHRPGPGVGGHCIPVDPWFLVSADESSADLIRTARDVNDAQPGLIARRALDLVREVSVPHIAILGAAYKPGVSDARESPTTGLANALTAAGASITVHDPNVKAFVPELTANLQDTVDGAVLIVVMVGHKEYVELDPSLIKSRVRTQSVLDTCNVLDREVWTQSGFEFHRYADSH